MTILTMPDATSFKSNQFGLVSNTSMTKSAFNDFFTTKQRIGQHWVGTYTLEAMRAESDKGKSWQAFLWELDGMSGRFYAYDPDRRTPSGTGGGTPVVNGASQKGNFLITDGWNNSETVLEIGDYFEVNNELKMVVNADVASDGSGNATIQFVPELRRSPDDNATITVTNPVGIFMLDNDTVVINSDTSKVLRIEFSFREAFDFTDTRITEAGDTRITEAGDIRIL